MSVDVVNFIEIRLTIHDCSLHGSIKPGSTFMEGNRAGASITDTTESFYPSERFSSIEHVFGYKQYRRRSISQHTAVAFDIKRTKVVSDEAGSFRSPKGA